MILLWCFASSSASPARLHVSLWSAGWRTACLPACCLGLTISSPPKAGSQYLSLSLLICVCVCVCVCVCMCAALSLSLSENLLIREDCSNAANQSPPPLLNSTLQLLKRHTLCTDTSFSLPPSPVDFYHFLRPLSSLTASRLSLSWLAWSERLKMTAVVVIHTSSQQTAEC